MYLCPTCLLCGYCRKLKSRIVKKGNSGPGVHADQAQSSKTLTIDWQLYERYLESSDLSDDQKRELIETLWTIICEFVALGFGVHPVQQAQMTCGKDKDFTAKPVLTGADEVEWEGKRIIETFDDAAVLGASQAAEGIET